MQVSTTSPFSCVMWIETLGKGQFAWGRYKLCVTVLKLELGAVNNIKKDDNIHKNEALKRKNKRTLTLVECQNVNVKRW